MGNNTLVRNYKQIYVFGILALTVTTTNSQRRF